MVKMKSIAGLMIACGVAACAPQRDDASTRDGSAVLLDPGRFAEVAPAEFRARFETNEGVFLVEVDRTWAPHGADRFYNLVRAGFYDDVRFFRVVDGFVASWGLHGHPRITEAWERRSILDDEPRVPNTRGRVSFAHHGVNTRTTIVFVNLRDNPGMDREGFAPFGEVVEGMDVVERLFSGYGDASPRGQGPVQAHIRTYGNAYLDRDFPELDSVLRATIEGEPGEGEPRS